MNRSVGTEVPQGGAGGGGKTRNSGQGPERMGKVLTSLTISPKTFSIILSLNFE